MTFSVLTAHPAAHASPDHTHPLGCVNDNSRCAGFVAKASRLYELPRVLDLGCAGGGMVADFVDAGCEAVGIEGSTLPGDGGRGEWPRLGRRFLFTADATRPFTVLRDGQPWRADVVTAWEFLEHVAESDLPGVVANVRRHVAPGGIFVASVATFPDPPRHQTVRDRDWWLQRLGTLGLAASAELVDYFDPDWVRSQPGRGFHVVARCD